MNLLINQDELENLLKRSEKWDLSVAIEVPHLIETIKYFIEERKTFQSIIEKVKQIEQEKKLLSEKLEYATNKLREVAAIVSEYYEDEEITSLNAHKKINEAIEKFIKEIDNKQI